MHVIVTEGDVRPPVGAELLGGDLTRGAVGIDDRGRQNPRDLAVQQQDVVPRRRIRHERRTRARHIGDCKDREIEFGKRQSVRCGIDDMHAHRREEPENAPRLRGAWRVVIAGDHDDDGIREFAAQARELLERVEDRRVGRPDRMEDVAGDHDDLRRQRDGRIHGVSKSHRHVGFALIDAARRQALVLPIAEMQVRQVHQTHSGI